MKLTFKTIAGKNFSLEVEESISIADVKAKVEETQGPDCPKELCKLVYKGKVLDDGTTVADNKVDETGFIVVFINKKKEEAKPAAVRLAPRLDRQATRPSSVHCISTWQAVHC